MAHLKEDIHPLGCLFGAFLEGSRNKENRQETFVRIFGFFCQVKKCNDECKKIALRLYGDFELFGNIDDSMSGVRGIIEPREGYTGYLKKKGTHTPFFTVNGFPAVCFFDNFETKQKAIKLAQAKALEFSKKKS